MVKYNIVIKNKKELSDNEKITGKKIKKFEEHLIHEEKSKATVDKYVHDVTAFAAWFGSAALNKNESVGI